MDESYSSLANKTVDAANGIRYAYRDTGGHDGTPPLVLLQHFRGNLDNWDPVLVDALATSRRVITFDNAGVGASTGTTPDTVEQMARDAIAFIAAVGLSQADLLGFSIGSFVAQEIALRRPALVRRLALASSAPQGAAGMHGWAPEVIGAVGTPQPNPEGYLGVFFAPSEASQQAGKEALGRMYARKDNRDDMTSWANPAGWPVGQGGGSDPQREGKPGAEPGELGGGNWLGLGLTPADCASEHRHCFIPGDWAPGCARRPVH
jgi:pimeloyl-ACP methyl ester carboxylesterase